MLTIKRSLYFILVFVFLSCKQSSQIDQVLQSADSNRIEIETVLHHYKISGNNRKLKAAEFLISNMKDKYSYEGEILQHYDLIFNLYDSLYNEGVTASDPPVIKQAWHYLTDKYGQITPALLAKKYDCRNLKASFLIQSIDQAFSAWEHSPLYNPEDFSLFCEYILPYRVQSEPVEEYRERYYNEFKHIVDTAKTIKGIIEGFHMEIWWNRHYRGSNILWDYPVDLPISRIEIGRRGACRHLTMYTALYMRACGLPVTIDRAIWANRSQGHSWNVLLLDSGRIYPFDALDRDSLKLTYKPAKVFRKNYSYDLNLYRLQNNNDIPSSFLVLDEKDVTHEYCKTADISIPIQFSYEEYKKKKYSVICVFDNNRWSPVYWGSIKSNRMNFLNMASDVAYVAAYYDNGKIIPATEPFLLRNDGSIEYLKANRDALKTMCLSRKYPRFKRIEDHAWGVRRTDAEASNNAQFNEATKFFSVYEVPFEVTDSFVVDKNRYRYVRLNSSTYRNASLAEVEFYGKKNNNAKEEKLTGKIIGYPPVKKEDEHPYPHAMDGNLETFFYKERDEIGWVGLDLGAGNESLITRIRFCPRSDTNFILKDDVYELLYWDQNEWKSMGKQVASQYNYIIYENVPSETMYLLRNHTRGKEERIFTYENDEQIWW